MLSDASRRVVAETLPVVGEDIGEIAQRFYRRPGRWPPSRRRS
jgi:hemoglobin-like flavoprotein